MDALEELVAWDCAGQVTELCRELIRIPSENPPGDVTEMAARVEGYLNDAGLPVRRVVSPGGRPSLVAELDFGPGPTLVFNGHLDVVPAGDRNRWTCDPFGGELRDGYVWGRGASDMKGGLAAQLVALARIADLPGLRGKLVFMAVPDEETGGEEGTKLLLEQGVSGDACLIAEPSGLHPTVGQKGNIWLQALASGEPAHGSLSPAAGTNAIPRMCRAIDCLYRLWDIDWQLPEAARELIFRTQALLRAAGRHAPAEALGRVSVNVGTIRGGEKVNMVAGQCEAQFDLRVPIGLPTARVLAELKRLARAEGVEEVELNPLGPPNEANHTPPDHPFVQAVLESVAQVTGESPQPTLQWASSDARFFRYRGIPTVQYGPAELEGIHGYNERVRVQALGQAARVYAQLACRWLGGSSPR